MIRTNPILSVSSIGLCLLAVGLFCPPVMAADLPVTITPNGGGHKHPSICQTKEGTLIAVYQAPNTLKAHRSTEGIMCSRSTDGGKTWEPEAVIPASTKRPDSIRKVEIFETYPGTADVLPDGRVLVTWNYIAYDKPNGYHERALVYALSSDQGRTWSEQGLIGPINGKHLGAVRHNVLAWPDGRWLLPLRDGPPRLYDPKTGELTVFRVNSPDGKEHSFQQIVRTPKGTLLAMGMVTLRSTDQGATWQMVDSFRPVDKIDTAEGRYLTVLKDGRVLVTWGTNRGNQGVSINFSASDGVTWNNDHTAVLLPELSIPGRYYSARTIQVDDDHLGIVFLNSGVKFLKARIDRVAK